MKTRLRPRLGLVALFSSFSASLLAAALAACGARTGLPVAELPQRDAGADVVDAAEEDAAEEPDVIEEDAPPIPPPDLCQDAGITYIYVVTRENELQHFYPPTRSFASNGALSCPAGGTPFSMAVDRAGIAYVLFSDNTLTRVDPAAMSCTDTGFATMQPGFDMNFGMGYSADTTGPGETLYVAAAGAPDQLAQVDTTTFGLSVLGTFSSAIGEAELTGTGDGKLYAFGIDNGTGSTHLAEIDKTNAAVLSDVTLPISAVGISAWAFAFWGGKFYFFTAVGAAGTTVSEYDPVTGAFDPSYATSDQGIVGAGVSTCAPL